MSDSASRPHGGSVPSSLADPASGTAGGAPRGEGYLPDIDGLRAVAVLAVIAHHFDDRLLPGGYLGVDIFFVISGFVITASLAGRPAATLRDFLLGFYTRRIQRLWPALVLCVVATGLLVTLFDPNPEPSLATGAAALFGLSNLELLGEATDYFGSAAELDAFTHTWSLGVEEQFYFLFPLLFWSTGFGGRARAGRVRFALTVGLLALASLASFLYWSRVAPPRAFYLMPARFWEIGAGCLAYAHWSRSSSPRSGRFAALLAAVLLAGLIAILFAPLELQVEATAGSVVLTALLLLTLAGGSGAFRLLAARPLVYLGTISYSLYLWHWSVLSLSRRTIGIHAWSAPLQLGLMVGLAALSTRYLERPLRRAAWSPLPGRPILYGLGASCVALLLIWTLSLPIGGRLFLGEHRPRLAWNGNGTTLTPQNCIGTVRISSPSFERNCSLVSTNGRTLLAVGDSQTAHLIPMLTRLHLLTGVGIRFYSERAHVFPGPPESWSTGRSLRDWRRVETRMRRYFDRQLRSLRRGDVVILSSRYELRWSPYPLDWEQRKGEKFQFYDDAGRPISRLAALVLWREQLAAIARRAEERGVAVVVFAPLPVFEQPLEVVDVAPAWFHRWNHRQELDRDFLVRHFAATNDALRQLERSHHNVVVFDTLSAVCPATRRTCAAQLDGETNYRDLAHLSHDGSNRLAEPFLELLQARGLLGQEPQRSTAGADPPSR